jgi:hypothetical protein
LSQTGQTDWPGFLNYFIFLNKGQPGNECNVDEIFSNIRKACAGFARQNRGKTMASFIRQKVASSSIFFSYELGTDV